MKIMEEAEKPKRRRKPAKATIATSGADLLSAYQGRPKRLRPTADKGRYGSADVVINQAMSTARQAVNDCQNALEILAVSNPTPVAEEEEQAKVCCCGEPHRFSSPHKRPGGTREQALQIDDDDDDDNDVVEIAFTPGVLSLPQIPISKLLDKEGGKFIKDGFLSAEDIVAHQKGSRHKESEEIILPESNNKQKGSRPSKEGDNNADDEDDDDDDEFGFSSSPKKGKGKSAALSETEDEGPDWELEDESSSDKEPEQKPEDPYADLWVEHDIMYRQEFGTRKLEVVGATGCHHKFELSTEVGKACSLCGLIKEDIKDMSFAWRRPRPIPKARVQKEGRQNWDGGDTEGPEEEKLVGMAPLEVHLSLEESMHPHQLEGFKFLSKNLVEEDSGGCMLAFAPGTGKSFLVISFIQSFMVKVPDAKPMIVAPKSMLRPWVQEFKKWEVQELNLLNLYEADDQLEMLKKWMNTEMSVLLVGYSQVTITSGEVGRILTEVPGLLVLDEGHLARTEHTKILKSLSRVHTKRRVLLSGTPFNNNFEEFYTTLELVRPNFMQRASAQMCPTLNTLDRAEPPKPMAGNLPKKPSNAGRQAFKDVIGEKFEAGKHANITKALTQLRELISPFVAWHKGQILDTLPGISDLTIMLELTPSQRELLKNDKSEMKDTLQKRAAAVYVHPILEPVADKGRRSENDPRLRGDLDVTSGVKLRWVLDLIQLCEAAKEKVLIFSEYLYSLALIENMASQRMGWVKGTQILRLDGKMQPQEREKVVNLFNQGSEARMLCASIKACGEGISLVGASRVVLLEVLWNPAVSRQAISRAFRIGQQKKVFVYRLVAADTYEEHRMHAAATRKEWLSKLLFDPSISCDDHTSILWDVTNQCGDRFFDAGPLLQDVKKIYEREFC